MKTIDEKLDQIQADNMLIMRALMTMVGSDFPSIERDLYKRINGFDIPRVPIFPGFRVELQPIGPEEK